MYGFNKSIIVERTIVKIAEAFWTDSRNYRVRLEKILNMIHFTNMTVSLTRKLSS